MENKNIDKLLIIDFGSQFTQLIARSVRKLNVYCEIHPIQKINNKFLKKLDPKAIIFSGGPASVYQNKAPLPPNNIFKMNIPIFGICDGQQVIINFFWAGLKVINFHMNLAEHLFIKQKNSADIYRVSKKSL